MSGSRFGTASLLLATALLTSCGLLITPQHRIATARRDIQAGNWSDAGVQLNKALQSDPKNVEGWLLLTETTLDTGDPNHARIALSKALANGAKGPEVDALRVRVWLALGEPKAILDAVAHHELALGEPAQSIAVARAYAALGQNDQAVKTLEPIVREHPDLSKARVVLAQALADEGRIDDALEELDAAARTDRRSPEIPLLAGRMLASQGRNAAAESEISLALERMPPSQRITDRALAYTVLTEVRLARSEVEAAAESQAELAKLEPQAPITKLLDARVRLARNDIKGALDELGLLVLTAPRFVQARMLLGTLDLNRGDFEQAVVQAQAVLEQSSGDIAARKLLAAAELELGEPDSALRDLAPTLTGGTPDPQVVILTGVAASRVGGADAVLERLENRGYADTGNPVVRVNLAEAYLRANRPADALTILEKTPEGGDPRRDGLLIASLSAARGPRAAADEVDRLLARHPRDPGMLRLAASFFTSQRDFVRAGKLLREALTVKPNEAATTIELARVEVAAGDPAAARGPLEAALAAHPKVLPLRLALADVLVRAKAFSEAHATLEAARPSSDGPTLELALAEVDLARGDLKQANEEIDRAIGSGPGETARVRRAASLLLAAKQRQAALERVDALVARHPGNPGALALKGDIETALGDSAAAAAAYRQAQSVRPTAAGALSLYRAQLASGEREPEKPLEQWLARAPGEWQFDEVLGEYYISVHSLERAAKAFEAALQASPRSVVVLNNLAWIYGELNDPRGEPLAKKAYELAPKLPQVNDTLGWIWARGANASRSVPLLAYAAKADPANPEFEYHYAYALAKTGRSAEARSILTKLLASKKPFDSRAEAERLLASTGAAPAKGAPE